MEVLWLTSCGHFLQYGGHSEFILFQITIMDKLYLSKKSSYLRVPFIFSRYISSHACVLMARIPETTWFIKEMRRSDSAAIRSRSVAPAVDSPAKYGTRKHKKSTPISACQPIKYKNKIVTAMSSRNVNPPGKNRVTVSSSSR